MNNKLLHKQIIKIKNKHKMKTFKNIHNLRGGGWFDWWAFFGYSPKIPWWKRFWSWKLGDTVANPNDTYNSSVERTPTIPSIPSVIRTPSTPSSKRTPSSPSSKRTPSKGGTKTRKNKTRK